MKSYDRFFLPGTARFLALGTAAALSTAMMPAEALASDANTASAATGTFSGTVVAVADVSRTRAKAEIPVDTVEKSDPHYRSLFANWKSVETRQNGGPAVNTAVSIPSRMPVEAVRFSSDFGYRTHPVTGGRKMHDGIDMAAPSGTPIYATADGTVETARWYGGYGNFIEIDHGGDMETRYGHMSKLNVSAGQVVRKGDLIGFVGSTGRSTGPHLHYEVRIAGEAVDPSPYLHADTFKQAFASATGMNGAGGPE